MKERKLWIDLLKGFGIILVTFAHLYPNYILENNIYSFHMCLFFFISGYLFTETHSKKSYALKKIKNLIVPFLIWNFICSVIESLRNHNITLFFQKLFIIKGNLCLNAPIWFLLILFMVEIIFLFLSSIKIIKNKYMFYSLIFFLNLLVFILIGGFKLTLKANLIPLGLMFFSLGYIYKLISESNNYKYNKIIIFLLCFILITINVIFSAILNTRISYTEAYFGNMLYFIIASISGVLGYFILFEKNACNLKHTNFLTKIGSSSMTIMVFQYPLFYIYNLIGNKFFGFDNIWQYRSTLKAFILCVLTILLILSGAWIVKKIFRNNKKMEKVLKYVGIV